MKKMTKRTIGTDCWRCCYQLELVERGPIIVESVEQFRMDGIGGLESPAISALAGGIRELLGLIAVEVGESADHRIARCEARRILNRLEKAAAHDLEAFLWAGRPPGGFYAPKGVLDALQGCLPTFAADLDV